MVNTLGDMPSMLVCGTQTTIPPVDYLNRLRLHLRSNPEFSDIFEAVVELPELWPLLLEANPSLSQVPGRALLEDLSRWLVQESDLTIPDTLPNTQLAPLTVLIQILEYLIYLRKLGSTNGHARVLQAAQQGGIQGLCIGLLTATALACSPETKDIPKNAAIAIRIAACIGAVVDLDRSGLQKFVSFSCRWPSNLTKDDICDLLGGHPEVMLVAPDNLEKDSNADRPSLLQAYISVQTDVRDATITGPEADLGPVFQDLAEKGCKTKMIQLNGRFHHPVYQPTIKNLCKMCEMSPSLQFSQESRPLVPLRASSDGTLLNIMDSIHETLFQSILCQGVDWHQMMSLSVTNARIADPTITPFTMGLGLVHCVPRSLLTEQRLSFARAGLPPPLEEPRSQDLNRYPDDSIAIIGAACRFGGAESMESFWSLIREGSCSMEEISIPRFSEEDSEGRIRGHFVKDANMFDHTMFGVSPREALCMDPQQRIALEVAYQTVESAGILSLTDETAKIGCYVGVSATDYEHACVNPQDATAFSYTGTAPAFVSGKISHHFGWKGPSVVFNNACSSSGVAIHTACKAIKTGECEMALAGGVNVIASHDFHKNLSAAHMVNGYGPCRPFDAGANGYCRGEGCGFVMLKRFSAAIADKDQILGVIMGSGVNQNAATSPITVPVSESQVNLYQQALSEAGLSSDSISYVEAHGTGTPRGDPIEVQSIRQTFRGDRQREVHLGSVKANIGHTESASGIASLIKVILMMQHGEIPPQANFAKLNPVIPSLEEDHIIISTEAKKWTHDFRVACVSNYGASGSNAALVICQSPQCSAPESLLLQQYPVMLTAHSALSLARLCVALRDFVKAKSHLGQSLLANLAFTLSRRQNQNMPLRRVFAVESTTDLVFRLEEISIEYQARQETSKCKKFEKPVVLVFAGQTGNTINLHQDIYQGCALFRFHLDQCDKILHSMGLPSLFPTIFQSEPVTDLVHLHSKLFSLQYSCAASWIDAGLKVDRLVGHSFGQLTALCVSGALALPDALRLITGRAALFQKRWSGERGRMLRVDADMKTVHSIVQAAAAQGHRVEVACYNGPSRHILSGLDADISHVETNMLSEPGSPFSGIRYRQLETTHGFHSDMVNCLMPGYQELAQSITYQIPTIPIETCSEGQSWPIITSNLVAQQTREPVFFRDAIARIVQQLGPCSWVEAGSGSIGVMMARRALSPEYSSLPHTFHSASLGTNRPLAALTEMTLSLWEKGQSMKFWLYHQRQASSFQMVHGLPLYSFDKSCHWLSGKRANRQNKKPQDKKPGSAIESSIQWHQDRKLQVSKFEYEQVHSTSAAPGQHFVSLCIELAVQAAAKNHPQGNGFPRLENFDINSSMALCDGESLDVTMAHGEGPEQIVTVKSTIPGAKPCATVSIMWEDPNTLKLRTNWRWMQRLIGYERCARTLADPDASLMRGPFLSLTAERLGFGPIMALGVNQITICGKEAVFDVSPSASHKSIPMPFLVEIATQVGEMHIDWMQQGQKYNLTALDQITTLGRWKSDSAPYKVYTQYGHINDQEIVSDILVYQHKTLTLAVLGAHYCSELPPLTVSWYQSPPCSKSELMAEELVECLPEKNNSPPEEKQSLTWVTSQVKQLLYLVSGISPQDQSLQDRLPDLGVDSLASIELERVLLETFNIHLSLQNEGGDQTIEDLCHIICSHVNSGCLKSNMPISNLSRSFASDSSSPTLNEV